MRAQLKHSLPWKWVLLWGWRCSRYANRARVHCLYYARQSWMEASQEAASTLQMQSWSHWFSWFTISKYTQGRDWQTHVWYSNGNIFICIFSNSFKGYVGRDAFCNHPHACAQLSIQALLPGILWRQKHFLAAIAPLMKPTTIKLFKNLALMQAVEFSARNHSKQISINHWTFLIASHPIKKQLGHYIAVITIEYHHFWSPLPQNQKHTVCLFPGIQIAPSNCVIRLVVDGECEFPECGKAEM